MAGNKDNMFVKAAEKRKVEQQTLESQLMAENVSKSEKEDALSNRKVPMNISVYRNIRDMIKNEAARKQISASVLIQLWALENCGK